MTTTPALNDDLVRSLRLAPPFGTTRLWDERLADEAASALEAQSKEIEALRSALEHHRSDRDYIIGWNDGFDHSVKEDLKFPTMLRKMWSGSEVQNWLDEQFAERRARTALKGA